MTDALLSDPATAPISFGKTFVASEAFRLLFREGMGLVEETAAYLDGEGREESSSLSRNAALAYATESMRLTTRLMQVASWLLLQRAVAEGEMTLEQANRERQKVRVTWQDTTANAEMFDALPGRLRELVALSLRLQARIVHLDELISAQDAAPAPVTESPVNTQIDMLKAAFAR